MKIETLLDPFIKNTDAVTCDKAGLLDSDFAQSVFNKIRKKININCSSLKDTSRTEISNIINYIRGISVPLANELDRIVKSEKLSQNWSGKDSAEISQKISDKSPKKIGSILSALNARTAASVFAELNDNNRSLVIEKMTVSTISNIFNYIPIGDISELLSDISLDAAYSLKKALSPEQKSQLKEFNDDGNSDNEYIFYKNIPIKLSEIDFIKPNYRYYEGQIYFELEVDVLGVGANMNFSSSFETRKFLNYIGMHNNLSDGILKDIDDSKDALESYPEEESFDPNEYSAFGGFRFLF